MNNKQIFGKQMRSILLGVLLLAAEAVMQQVVAQSADFARGADVSWCTEMEASGKKFYDAQGRETELMELMKGIGMNAIRLRVWVNPETAYGAWSDKADVLQKARRAHAQGLQLMIDFHYSDFFADPSRQTKPAAWKDYSLTQLKQAVADHTSDILSALKDEGIEPRWVQVGNETRSGMIWDDGRLDWNKSGRELWANYVALSNAGYDAVKSVLPQTLVIVHIDKGPDDNAWFFNSFKQYGGKFDMIGLSHYPSSSWQSDNSKTAANVTSLAAQFNVPVMIAETGYSASNETLAAQVMQDFFDKLKNVSGCAGVFYWEPEVYGWWKPTYYSTLGWNGYGMGAFTSQGRPSAALAPFAGDNTGMQEISYNHPLQSKVFYDLNGRKVEGPRKGIYVAKGEKVVR